MKIKHCLKIVLKLTSMWSARQNAITFPDLRKHACARTCVRRTAKKRKFIAYFCVRSKMF